MRNATPIALIAILTACASTSAVPRKPVAVAAQPTAAPPASPPEAAIGEAVVTPGPAPDVTATAPTGWREGATDDMPPGTVGVFVHPSGHARLFVAVVPSDGGTPAERALSFLPKEFAAEATTSIMTVTADGATARFNWTAHPSVHRTYGAQGSVLVKAIDGRPDLLLLVSGVWPQGESAEMSPYFSAVASSVTVR
jgi:hypothetical protein